MTNMHAKKRFLNWQKKPEHNNKIMVNILINYKKCIAIKIKYISMYKVLGTCSYRDFLCTMYWVWVAIGTFYVQGTGFAGFQIGAIFRSLT
jgi:hypothetical protein